MSGWDPAAGALLALLPQTGRGPRRGGIFALWLTLRVAQDLVLSPPIGRVYRLLAPIPSQRDPAFAADGLSWC